MNTEQATHALLDKLVNEAKARGLELDDIDLIIRITKISDAGDIMYQHDFRGEITTGNDGVAALEEAFWHETIYRIDADADHSEQLLDSSVQLDIHI